mmetsp:Transcript_90205/g.291612  ORF Transcript_90205/g.291612 Transcript_90205/m.291612 type:complete len:340 (-) Transcript_90205:2132-3151(-)
MSLTVSPEWVSSFGKSAPAIGYLHTSALRRSTIARRVEATSKRAFCSGFRSGKHTDTAMAVTSSALPKALRTQHGRGAAGRSVAMERRQVSKCEGSSWVMTASILSQMAATLPAAPTRRPQAGSICRSMTQSFGCGLLSVDLFDMIDSNTAVPTGRGAADPGDSRSSASNSVGAWNGLTPSPSRHNSPASGHGSVVSIQIWLLFAGPSRAHARQRRSASPAPRKAWAARRRSDSLTKRSASLPSESASNPSTSKPAPTIANKSGVCALASASSMKRLTSAVTASIKKAPLGASVKRDNTACTARALCSNDSTWPSDFVKPLVKDRPKRLSSCRSEVPGE